MTSLPLTLGTAGVGLMAGLFLAFGVAVMPALRGADDASFVDVMQRINVAIVNPVFLLVFLGPVAALGIAVALGPQRGWAGAALALYVLTLGLTIGVNIPLNNALDAAGTPADPGPVRAAFEQRWMLAHHARTLTNLASFGCALVALRAL